MTAIATARRGWLALALAAGACASEPEVAPALELFEWERGIALRVPGEEPPVEMSLWFYEWNLFDARERGQFTKGSHELERSVASDARSARIRGPGLDLALEVDGAGVALELAVTNTSAHDWPTTAALVACFNPGPPERRTEILAHHRATYFLGAAGLERMPDRHMRFNAELEAELRALSPELTFDFSERWPTDDARAHAPLLVRESTDGRWVTAVAWDDFVGVQAHNPWACLHLATRVGPLARGETKRVRGKLYLFAGNAADALARFRRDFVRR